MLNSIIEIFAFDLKVFFLFLAHSHHWIVCFLHLFSPGKHSSPKTYFSEFDLLLVIHFAGGGTASAVHKPPSVSNQNHIRLLHNLRQTACQCVPHLVLQGSSVGLNLKEGLYLFECAYACMISYN